MMKKSLLIFLLSGITASASAQKNKWSPWIMPEAGIVAGALNPAADFRLTTGIRLKQLRLGAGVAFDEYRDYSYPIYLQARWQLKWRKWKPFVFSSAGYNIRSGTDTIFTWFGNRAQTYRGGLYAEAGVGLTLSIRKKERLFISISQSYKRSSSTFQDFRWLGPGNSVTVPATEIYRMNRLGLRIGWLFGK